MEDKIERIEQEIERLIKESDKWTGCSNGFAADRVDDLKNLLSLVKSSLPAQTPDINATAEEWSNNEENTSGCDYIGVAIAKKAFIEGATWMKTWLTEFVPHWKKSTLPGAEDVTGFNSDYFSYKGYIINYKGLFKFLPKDD